MPEKFKATVGAVPAVYRTDRTNRPVNNIQLEGTISPNFFFMLKKREDFDIGNLDLY